MDSMQTEIARFLAEKAMRQVRATYQQVGDAVGWNHPTGCGLGKNLEVILHALHDRGLPPLTTILVKRGDIRRLTPCRTYVEPWAISTLRPPSAKCSRSISSVPDLAPDGDDFRVAGIFG